MKEIIDAKGQLMMLDIDRIVAIQESGVPNYIEVIMDAGAVIVINIPYQDSAQAIYGVTDA